MAESLVIFKIRQDKKVNKNIVWLSYGKFGNPMKSRYKQKTISIEVKDKIAYDAKIRNYAIARHKAHQQSVTLWHNK